MTKDQTSEWMSSIYKDLQRAVSSWGVWKEVRNQLSRQPAGHFEFFDSVQIALLDSVVLAISRVLDEDKRTMSILNLVKTESRLSDSELKQRVEGLPLKYELTFNKIKQRRDQYIAHQDRIKRDPDDPLEVVEIDKFIDSLVDGFRELGGFVSGGGKDRGKASGALSPEKVEAVSAFLENGGSVSGAARTFGVSRPTVRAVKDGTYRTSTTRVDVVGQLSASSS